MHWWCMPNNDDDDEHSGDEGWPWEWQQRMLYSCTNKKTVGVKGLSWQIDDHSWAVFLSERVNSTYSLLRRLLVGAAGRGPCQSVERLRDVSSSPLQWGQVQVPVACQRSLLWSGQYTVGNETIFQWRLDWPLTMPTRKLCYSKDNRAMRAI